MSEHTPRTLRGVRQPEEPWIKGEDGWESRTSQIVDGRELIESQRRDENGTVFYKERFIADVGREVDRLDTGEHISTDFRTGRKTTYTRSGLSRSENIYRR